MQTYPLFWLLLVLLHLEVGSDVILLSFGSHVLERWTSDTARFLPSITL